MKTEYPHNLIRPDVVRAFMEDEVEGGRFRLALKPEDGRAQVSLLAERIGQHLGWYFKGYHPGCPGRNGWPSSNGWDWKDPKEQPSDIIRALKVAGWVISPMDHPGYYWEFGERTREEVREALKNFGPPVEDVSFRFHCAPWWYLTKVEDAPLWLSAVTAATESRSADGVDNLFGGPDMAQLVG